MSTPISSQEAAMLNKLGQKHQIARAIADEEEIIRHLEFGAKTLYIETERHKRILEALRLKGRGGP